MFLQLAQGWRGQWCEQYWLADITHLPTGERIVYLSLIAHVLSRNWPAVAFDTLQAEVAKALRMAQKGEDRASGRAPP